MEITHAALAETIADQHIADLAEGVQIIVTPPFSGPVQSRAVISAGHIGRLTAADR